MLRRLLLATVALLAVVFAATPAHATSIDLRGGGLGSLSWAGGSAPLVGSNILIDVIEGQGTPNNPGNHTVTNGALNFTTGAFLGQTGNEYNFGSGGSLTLTGGVPDAGIPDGTSLVSGGTWGESHLIDFGSGFGAVAGLGGTMDLSALLNYFGLASWIDQLLTYVDTEIVLALHWNDDSDHSRGFTADIVSTDFNNSLVPEAGSLVLLGTGLIALSWIFRRRPEGLIAT